MTTLEDNNFAKLSTLSTLAVPMSCFSPRQPLVSSSFLLYFQTRPVTLTIR